MDTSGTTHVIAEISVGFIGFAGIVGALARGQLTPERRHTWLGFWTMIEFGLTLLLASLLPSLLGLLGAEDPMRVASAIVGGFLVAHIALVTPVFARARRGVAWPLGIRVLDVATFLGLLVAATSQLANAGGLVFPSSASVFVLGLYALLTVSSLNFALLAYLILLPELEVNRR